MQFNCIFTEEKYNNHLNWLEDRKTGSQLNLYYENLSNVDLSNARLIHTIIKGSTLKSSCLVEAALYNADLSSNVFSFSDLSNVKLEGANCTESIFHKTNLSGADLSHANFAESVLTKADLTGTTINYCIGNGKEIKTIYIEEYIITYTKHDLAIGCIQYPLERWKNKDTIINDLVEREILDYDLIRFKKYYSFLMDLIKKFPAK